jgi:hypothetical protein
VSAAVEFAAPGSGGRWRRFVGALPMRTSLLAVGVVWLLGCVWSYQEQSAFAASHGFTFPHLLPLVIDGFAASMAGVSWAASLDARPAIPARLATVIAVGASSASNGVWAYLRDHHDRVTVALGVAVPIAAAMAFEVLLAELRRQVQRRRGLPAPVAVPYPRLIRLVLAPWQSFRAWRELVLRITAIESPDTHVSATTTDDRQSTNPVAEAENGPTIGPKPEQDQTEAAAGAAAGPPTAVLPRSALGEDVTDLLEVGREVAADLVEAGKPVSRKALIEGLRARDLSCSTDRGAALAAVLRAEQTDHIGQLEVVS